MYLILYPLIILTALISDQLTKHLISSSMRINESTQVIKDFFYITYVENTGAAWSMFQGGRWFFVAVTSVMIVVLAILLIKNSNMLFRISASMIIGGGLGNLVDRIKTGSVVDFIDLYFGSYSFPVFNISDSFVSIGTVLLCLYVIIYERAKKDASHSR